MKEKLRVALVNESAALFSGFSKMGREILGRLHATGNFELFELANYIKTSDPRSQQFPWTTVGTIPEDNDEQYKNRYNSVQTAQFGSEIYEQFLLEHRIDICMQWTDFWMIQFMESSPFRKNIKLLTMACVDSEPSAAEWNQTVYQKADHLCTYTSYGKKILERDSGGKIKINEIIHPGANHEIFVPMDKKALRKEFGIPENAKVMGFFSRNQPRKLFPNLIEDFAKLIHHAIEKGDSDIANNTYLIIHSSSPDVGWSFSKHVLSNNIGHRVLFTYYCQACGNYGVYSFSSDTKHCEKCGKLSCIMPNTGQGIRDEDLAKLYNLLDAYVQYSVAEGLSLTSIESRMCGVPLFGTNYSALEEQTNIEGCFPIKVNQFYWEGDVNMTGQMRAYPDSDDFIKKMYSFLKLPQSVRDRYGALARKDAVENYSFERAAKLIEGILDKMEVPDQSKTWLDPTPKFAPNSQQIPRNFKNPLELINWGIDNILGQPELKYSYWANDLLKGINSGVYVDKNGGRMGMNGEVAINIMKNMANKHNYYEQLRLNKFFPKNDKKDVTWQQV